MFWTTEGEQQGDLQNLCEKGKTHLKQKKDQNNEKNQERMLGFKKQCM
jgi:hypothetical protein